MVYAIDGSTVALVVVQISKKAGRLIDEVVTYLFSFEGWKISLHALEATKKPQNKNKNRTLELMPLSYALATKLGTRLTEGRKNGTCSWLKPDGKTQVIIEYHNELVSGEPNMSYICSRYYRAVELIFGVTEYITAIDMWSVG